MKIPWTKKQIAQLKILKTAGASHAEIANSIGRSKTAVDRKVDRMDKGELRDAKVKRPDLQLAPVEFGYMPLTITDSGDWVRFGLISDTHFCAHTERLDVCHNAYDTFQKEGIRNVLHAGNAIDGYKERLNGGAVYETTIDGQVDYLLDKYPARKNITTHFITAGQEHETWMSGDGFNIGHYIELLARERGRNDLHYLGSVEADVEIKTGTKSTIIKVQHPGGGSSYARSYAGQKQVDSFQGGEKPNILIQGHFHVGNYMVERNVHVINMPGCQDQTVFARKKRLRMEVGFALLEFKINPADGSVTRCRVEFSMFWDRKYHQKFLKSDRLLKNGQLIIKR